MLKRDSAFKTVVKFETPTIKNGKQVVLVGTGFFMYKDNVTLYLITANHVAKNFTDKTIVYMAGKSKKVISVPLNNLKNASGVINHSSADVSAIGVDLSIFNSLSSDSVLYAASLININKINTMSRDEELTSIGFPKGLGTSSLFEPLSFRSYPASNIIRNVELDSGYKSDIFVMENASCGGYSGCPVLDLGYRVSALLTQTYETTIYGIMHGTIVDDTGGKMAVVTPAYYILQII